MSDLLLDTTSHDLALVDNDLFLVDGLDAIRQELDISLQFFLGEWFLDTRLGVPYFEKLLGHKPRLSAIKELFRDVIMKVNGVMSILDLNIDFDGRERILSVSFRAGTVEGEIDYTKELIL
jgi:hypothetical protein